MKAFNGLISRLDIAKETISVLEDKSTETSQNWNANWSGKYKSEKRKYRAEHPRTTGQFQRCVCQKMKRE